MAPLSDMPQNINFSLNFIYVILLEIHREFMTHGGLARSIYGHGQSLYVCVDDLNALTYEKNCTDGLHVPK